MSNDNKDGWNPSFDRVSDADVWNGHAIERRRETLSSLPKDALDARSATEAVKSDVALMRDIEDANERRFAAVAMAHNAADQKNYKQELERQDPHMAQIVSLALEDDMARQMAKEDRKNVEFQAGAAVDERLGRELANRLNVAVVNFPPEYSSDPNKAWGTHGSDDFGVAHWASTPVQVFADIGRTARGISLGDDRFDRYVTPNGRETIDASVREHGYETEGPTRFKRESHERDSIAVDEQLRGVMQQRQSFYERGGIEAAEAARLDANDVLRIQDSEVRAKALEEMGSLSESHAEYGRDLRRIAPETARLAEDLQRVALDVARNDVLYDRAPSADLVDKKTALMEDVRSLPLKNADVASEAGVPQAGVDQKPLPNADALDESTGADRVVAVPLDQARGEAVPVDQAALDRLSVKRLKDSAEAAAAMGLNLVEPARDRVRQRDTKAGQAAAPSGIGNDVEPDVLDVKSAGADVRAVVPPEVEQRYRRDGNTFYERDKPETIAFEDKGTRLETRSNSEQVADSLVRIAHARGWEEIKVSGKEEFKREVWLEASAQGMKVKGYSPSEEDKAALVARTSKSAQQESPSNAVESQSQREGGAAGDKASPTLSKQAQAFTHMNPAEGSAAYPELRGAYALAAAIDKHVEAAGFSAEQRGVIMAKTRSNLVSSIDRGVYPSVKLKEQVEIPIERTQEREAEATQGMSR